MQVQRTTSSLEQLNSSHASHEHLRMLSRARTVTSFVIMPQRADYKSDDGYLSALADGMRVVIGEEKATKPRADALMDMLLNGSRHAASDMLAGGTVVSGLPASTSMALRLPWSILVQVFQMWQQDTFHAIKDLDLLADRLTSVAHMQMARTYADRVIRLVIGRIAVAKMIHDIILQRPREWLVRATNSMTVHNLGRAIDMLLMIRSRREITVHLTIGVCDEELVRSISTSALRQSHQHQPQQRSQCVSPRRTTQCK